MAKEQNFMSLWGTQHRARCWGYADVYDKHSPCQQWKQIFKTVPLTTNKFLDDSNEQSTEKEKYGISGAHYVAFNHGWR